MLIHKVNFVNIIFSSALKAKILRFVSKSFLSMGMKIFFFLEIDQTKLTHCKILFILLAKEITSMTPVCNPTYNVASVALSAKTFS